MKIHKASLSFFPNILENFRFLLDFHLNLSFNFYELFVGNGAATTAKMAESGHFI